MKALGWYVDGAGKRHDLYTPAELEAAAASLVAAARDGALAVDVADVRHWMQAEGLSASDSVMTAAAALLAS